MRLLAGIAFLLVATEPVVVEAGGLASAGQASREKLRAVIAWRKGDACIGRYDRSEVALQVTKAPPAVKVRNQGLLDVIVLDDVALRAEMEDALNAPKGTWKLARTPDGTYVASALADTAWASEAPRANAPAPVARAVAEIRANLRSGDAQRQLDALQRMQGTRCFSLVQDALALADSSAKAMNPAGMRARTDDGREIAMATETTVGAEARRALYVVTNALRSEKSPRENASADAWRAWWRAILAGTAP